MAASPADDKVAALFLGFGLIQNSRLPAWTVIGQNTILDGLNALMDLGRTPVVKGAVSINGQHISAWLV